MNIECLLNRIAWAALSKYSVHKTLYETADGSWSDCENEANYLPWHNLPTGMLYCRVKYDTYYWMGNRRFERGEEEEAKAAAFFEYWGAPIIGSFLEAHNQYIKAVKRLKKLNIGKLVEV